MLPRLNSYRCAGGWSSLLGAAVLTLLAGCATAPYRYGGELHTDRDLALKPGETQVERGRRAPVLDTVGWVVGIPSKIIFLNHRVNNHDVSPQTEASLQTYLAANNLDKVKVRINEYDPGGEWSRLAHNESVGWFGRYTLGTLSLLGYTLLPGRVFGGDDYNPFTNTINIYSDIPSLTIYEGGRAKDYAQREYKGTYALAETIPGVNIWHETRATSDAMAYLEQNGTLQENKDGYRVLCPVYAVESTSPIASLTGAPLVLPAVVAGHVVGQVKAATLKDQTPPESVAPISHETTRPVSANVVDVR